MPDISQSVSPFLQHIVLEHLFIVNTSAAAENAQLMANKAATNGYFIWLPSVVFRLLSTKTVKGTMAKIKAYTLK